VCVGRGHGACAQELEQQAQRREANVRARLTLEEQMAEKQASGAAGSCCTALSGQLHSPSRV
jgi:hypothetical protein